MIINWSKNSGFRSPRINATLGAILAVFISAFAQAAPTVKTIMVESKTLRFPAISLDGIKYKALAFEYAVDGQLEITEISKQPETLNCAGKNLKNEYLAVQYHGPAIVFRVMDTARKNELALKAFDTHGTHYVGQGDCNSKAAIDAFKNNSATWSKNHEKKLIADAILQMNNFISENIALSYQDFRFPLFYLTGSESYVQRVNQAFDLAREGFDTNTQFGITIEALDMFNDAALIWESELQALTDSSSGSKAMPILLALHRNLSMTHLFLGQYDLARKHDAKALAKGMPQSDSIQETILAMEKNRMLSPAVSGNTILSLNLWRLGTSIAKNAELKEVAFETLKHALVQK